MTSKVRSKDELNGAIQLKPMAKVSSESGHASLLNSNLFAPPTAAESAQRNATSGTSNASPQLTPITPDMGMTPSTSTDRLVSTPTGSDDIDTTTAGLHAYTKVVAPQNEGLDLFGGHQGDGDDNDVEVVNVTSYLKKVEEGHESDNSKKLNTILGVFFPVFAFSMVRCVTTASHAGDIVGRYYIHSYAMDCRYVTDDILRHITLQVKVGCWEHCWHSLALRLCLY